MFRLFRACLLVFFILSTTTVANSETSWITKKSDKTKVELKKEKIKKTEYVKKKKKEIKKNKKEFKKEEKKISKEVKSWITKKIKEKYIDSIDKLPDGAIYFTGLSNSSGLTFYGYVLPDTNSKLISNYYETSTGFGYFNDGKTICSVGSTVRDVTDGEVTARISGKCNNGLKFTGPITQTLNSGWGSAKTADGIDRFDFDFNNDRTIITKIFNDNETKIAQHTILQPTFDEPINLKPTGKYYALLIGNSKYMQWASLTSPINDVEEIGKILKNVYSFEKVIIVRDASRDKIFEAFEKLLNITEDSDYVLVYYSGHGEEKGNKSYWIPVNAKKKYSSQWINISDIENYLSEIPAHHLAVMVDSCYFAGFKGSNAINEKVKSKHYNKLLQKRARLVLASGQNEPVSDTGKGNHSIFGITFIQALKNNENAISLMEIANAIGYAHANMNQMPIYLRANHWGHGGGDFIFITKK